MRRLLFGVFVIITIVLALSCGRDGEQGPPGPNGHNAVVGMTPAGAECANGGTIILSATDLNDNGLVDAEDGNIQSSTICNGTNGTNGSNGTNAPPTPFTPVGLIDPCGDAAGIYDEVFIRLSNGTLLASFSDNVNGQNTRFAVITAGSYMTTDGSRCYFSVDASGNLYNEHY